MRAISLSILVACLAGTPAIAQQLPETAVREAPRPTYDHYDPVLLNEYAIDAIRQGDATTAWILLERAGRLGPYDPRIQGNVRELRAYRTGKPSPPQAPAPRAQEGAGPAIPREPPALWPPR
jgi:hypothetical protein